VLDSAKDSIAVKRQMTSAAVPATARGVPLT
jgi:hypothetical protein